jgi:hypothetical protein
MTHSRRTIKKKKSFFLCHNEFEFMKALKYKYTKREVSERLYLYAYVVL